MAISMDNVWVYLVVVLVISMTIALMTFVLNLLRDLIKRKNGNGKLFSLHCADHDDLVRTVTNIDKTMAQSAVHIDYIREKIATLTERNV